MKDTLKNAMGKFRKRENPVYGKFTASRVQPSPRAIMPSRSYRNASSSAFGAVRTVKSKLVVSPQTVNQDVVAGADVKPAWSFMANQLPDIASYTAIFDAYRFRMVKVIIQGLNGALNSQTLVQGATQPMVTVFDPDDAVALTSYANALNYGSAMVHHPNCNDVRKFVPRISVATSSGNSTATSGNMNMKGQWIDTNTTAVPHFGFKAYLPKAAGAAAQLLNYSVIFEYVIEFKYNQ